MKISPVNYKISPNFCAKSNLQKSFLKNSKDFFEASAVVGFCSVPMFILLYLQTLYEDTFKKQTADKDV